MFKLPISSHLGSRRLVSLISAIALVTILLNALPRDESSTNWAAWEQAHEHTKAIKEWGGNLAPQWLRPGPNRKVEARRILDLKYMLEETYPTNPWADARPLNWDTLEELAECIATKSCRPGQEKVVLLASSHFSLALKGWTAGEDIWAASTIEAFTSLNATLLYTYSAMDTLLIYQAIPDLVKMVIWEGSLYENCYKRNDENHLEQGADGGWQTGKKGCIKRTGFEDGIPVWKSFIFHYWRDALSHLGHNWTLAPENYARGGIGNYYLGYSIETYCTKMKYYPADQREHRGLAYGKRKMYFDPTNGEYRWAGVLGPAIVAQAPGIDPKNGRQVPFEVIATVDAPGDDLFQQNLTNLGVMYRDPWTENLAKSKFMLGVGKPKDSPSPYDALCLGVPFINPLANYNPDNVTDRSAWWDSQHDGVLDIPEPYVYHVPARDQARLTEAMAKAIENPIERYIPEDRTKEAVLARHVFLLNNDWLAAAEIAIVEKYQGAEVDFLL
ncbi:hypothetical protein JCM24511_00324 [Saitozyma sp. JCM 24511]|nr:hypothetical protein JCM24511_00324 [Saitozyma sp. JCM 24511]